ncbi:hypothetical protein OEZ85_004544 [Tetradesmus obliquus]|uniref:Uncharacterized protein n=1 Tax=Tetradesmus obliquus TaxID=3088 RepID=A0ABY8ULG6_TETOB|nr:hypothetical protein OEZ85_004544 [Tetradesmus obliquus]
MGSAANRRCCWAVSRRQQRRPQPLGCHIIDVLRLAGAFSQALDGTSFDDDEPGAAQRQQAQQFASDALLQLLMVPAGIFVGALREQQQQQQQQHQQQQQQQQQQREQVCMQPYHLQLLAELRVPPDERQIVAAVAGMGMEGLPACMYAWDAVLFITQTRAAALQTTSSSSSPESGAAAQPSTAASVAVPGISSRLGKLLLLTMLEYAALAAAEDFVCLAHALECVVDVYWQLPGTRICSAAAAAAAAGAAVPQQAAPPASEEVLHCLLLEVGPAAVRSMRTACSAGSAVLADHAAKHGSSSAERACAQSVNAISLSLAALFEDELKPAMRAPQLPAAVAQHSRQAAALLEDALRTSLSYPERISCREAAAASLSWLQMACMMLQRLHGNRAASEGLVASAAAERATTSWRLQQQGVTFCVTC